MCSSVFLTKKIFRGGGLLVVVMALTQLAAAQESDSTTLEEIVVTGSYLRTSEDSISPLEFIDSEQMQNVPRTTLSDFFFTDLTQNVGLDTGYDEGTAQGRGGTASRGAGVDLRGLGKSNTLTLIDGRRTIEHAAADGNGWRNVDINMILPNIAVGRAEILLDGGSAIYGTDAVAGVVNMVPRYDFRGVEIQANTQHYQEDLGAKNWTGGIIGGWGDDRTSIIAAFEYHDQDRANVFDVGIDERALNPTTTDDEYIERTQGRYTYQALAPGKGGALSGSGALLPDPLCANAALLGVDPVYAGYLGDTAKVGKGKGAVTGPVCSLYDNDTDGVMRAESWRSSTFIAAQHELSDTMRIKADFSYGRQYTRDVLEQDVFVSAYSLSESSMPSNVPVNHPAVLYNESLQPGNWSDPDGYRVLTGDMLGFLDKREFTGLKSRTWRTSVSLDGEINDIWSYRLGSTYAESDVYGALPSLDLTPQANGAYKHANALQGLGGADCNPTTGTPGAGGCLWFNPFMSHKLPDGSLANSAEVVDWMVLNKSTDYSATFWQFSALVTGELGFELGGGTVGVALGAERRIDDLHADRDALLNAGLYDRQGTPPNNVGQEDYSSKQTVNSFFFEFDLPITENFGIQAAGRYEDYEDQFTTFNPKLGFLWEPWDVIKIRGSWGTSFKAPTVIHSEVVQSRASFVNLCDQTTSTTCRSGGGSISARTGARTVIAQAGNPNIQPQEADNLSFGFDWRVTPEINFGMTYTNIKFDGLIDIPGGTDTVNDPECNSGTAMISGVATGGGTEPLFIPIDDSANNHCFRLSADFDPAAPNVAGTIITAFVNPVNLAATEINSIDFRANWTHDFDFGNLSVRWDGSYLMDYKKQLNPRAGVEQYAGRRGTYGPGWSQWKVNMPIIFTRGDHEVRLTTRFLSGQDGVREGSEELASLVYADFLWNWRFRDDMKATFFVNNFTNSKPDLVSAFRSTQPRYRRVFGARFQYNWGGEGG